MFNCHKYYRRNPGSGGQKKGRTTATWRGFLLAAAAWCICVHTSVATTQEPQDKLQLQLKGHPGDVYRQKQSTLNANQIWMPGPRQFLDLAREITVVTMEIKIEAVRPDGWMLELDSTVRLRYKKATEASVVEFDSENQEQMDALRLNPSSADIVKQITTPFRLLRAGTGEVRAVDAIPNARVENLTTQRIVSFAPTPVALNDTWVTGKSVTNLAGVGQFTATGTATLHDLRMEGGELVAEVVETATLGTFKPDEESTEGIAMSDYTQKSTTILAIARGRVKRLEVELLFVLTSPKEIEQPQKFIFHVLLTEIK